jgi:RNA-directed DNA polymerase
MERHTELTKEEKTQRRQEGSANFVYVRYADDFVVLSNGTRKEAEQMREELCAFLSTELRLTLSREKTRITHLNDGFDFLGFKIRRSMGAKGMTMKILISDKGMEKHLGKLREATAPGTHKDSLVLKLKAINRIIAG